MDSNPSLSSKTQLAIYITGLKPSPLSQNKLSPLPRVVRIADKNNEHRIWAAIKREALLAASEKVATPAEIDEIFKNVLKTEKGPFEQMDVVGLDVVLDIEEHYAEKRQNIPTEPRDYLKELIKTGRLGVKNGHGFYDYGGK